MKIDLRQRAQTRGWDFEDYLQQMQKLVEATPSSSEESVSDPKLAYLSLNYRRCVRLKKQFQPSSEIVNVVKQLRKPILLLVLSEMWCGDSAQLVPCLFRITELSPYLTMKILSRDENPDIMDQFLTDGKRSIPKVIGLSEKGEVLFTWGPRPAPAQELFQTAREKGLSKEEVSRQLHTWYAQDKCQSLEKEWIQILSSIK